MSNVQIAYVLKGIEYTKPLLACTVKVIVDTEVVCGSDIALCSTEFSVVLIQLCIGTEFSVVLL